MDMLTQGKTGVRDITQKDPENDGYDICYGFAGNYTTPEMSCSSSPLTRFDHTKIDDGSLAR